MFMSFGENFDPHRPPHLKLRTWHAMNGPDPLAERRSTLPIGMALDEGSSDSPMSPPPMAPMQIAATPSGDPRAKDKWANMPGMGMGMSMTPKPDGIV
jgi:hypothetical protein